MGSVNYYLIESSILPEVYSKVIKAKRLLVTGEAGSVSAAVKMAGISRSAYYKYKDKILEYGKPDQETAVLTAKLDDNAGVLSAVMTTLYNGGANVLSVNQKIPVNHVADVTITVRLSAVQKNEELLENILKITGVRSADLL